MAALAVAVVAFELTSVAGGGIPSFLSPVTARAETNVSSTAATNDAASLELSAALGSLNSGTGRVAPAGARCAIETLKEWSSCARSSSFAAEVGSVDVAAATKEGPSPRWGAAMAYDAADGYVVLFGGWNATAIYDDTWKFVGGVWSELSPSTHPSPRAIASMTYDVKDGYIVLFSGLSVNSANVVIGAPADTWKFAGGQWTNLTSSHHPTSRWGATATYDATDHEVILFGGIESNSTTAFVKGLSDTWTFAGGKWLKLSLSAHPSARAGYGMTYDATDDYVVLFGGCHFLLPCDSPLNDTWTFAGDVWTRLSPSTVPKARGWMVLEFDPNAGYVVMFGGANKETALKDTWIFSDGVWSLLTPARSPTARCVAAFSYDNATGNVIVFGGTGLRPNYPIYNDTWSFSGTSWTKI